jgi:acyl carrier protein
MVISKEDMIRIVEETLHESKIEATEGQILANVDSLQLVDLVIRLEDRLRLKKSIVSDSTFSRTKSPFLTIETLADFLVGVA